MIYAQPDDWNFVDGRPYSWTVAGDGRFFDVMLTPTSLLAHGNRPLSGMALSDGMC